MNSKFKPLALVGLTVALALGENAKSLPRGASPDWWEKAQAQISQSEYGIHWQEKSGAYQSPNRRQNLRVTYFDDGFALQPRDSSAEDWKLDLRVRGVGKGGSILQPEKGSTVKRILDGSRLKVEHPGFDIDYDNGPEGMRQNFVVKSKPSGTGPLTVHLASSGNLTALDKGGSALFARHDVRRGHYENKVWYKDLKAWDAKGLPLPAAMKVKGQSVFLEVRDEDAAYPVTIDPLSTTIDWAVEGNQDSSSLGWSVASAGDVNGDGYSDVIVGAYTYDLSMLDMGRVMVYLGGNGGLAVTPAWTMDGTQVFTAEESLYFGWSVASAGDVNGDGYSDVIIGAVNYYNGPTGTQQYEGGAFIYLGGPAGIASTPNRIIEGNSLAVWLGQSVASAGDVNGDGYSDVIVGADGWTNGQLNEGKAWVHLGGASGVAATAFWQVEGNQTDGHFGFSVASAGDVNGDGLSDVIVGSPYGDNPVNPRNYEGFAKLFAGGSTMSTTYSWIVESNQASAGFGASVASAGDINGDGYSDIIVGAPFYDGGNANEGRAFVYRGGSGGIATGAPWTAEVNVDSARFGYSVASAGDVNGDGFADVMIGGYKYGDGANNGLREEGRVSIYQGGPAGLAATPSWSNTGGQALAQFGVAVASAGDVNGDGYSDIIAGVGGYSNGQLEEGRVVAYYGGPNGLSATSGWASESNQADAYFGYSVSGAGDVNGDGFADVIVGAYLFDNGENGEGRALLFQGSPTGLAATPSWTGESNQASAQFGQSVSGAGDVNGDGFADVIVGSPYFTHGLNYEGRAWVYYGGSGGLAASPAWTAEGGLASSEFGLSVSGAGDVNGDGFADVAVGHPSFTNVETAEGRARVYMGGAGGLSLTPAWTVESNLALAHFGWSVASAGDVNGDGYSDLIVGAPHQGIGPGAASLYLGGPGGLAATASWNSTGPVASSEHGATVSGAGDINGDGYSDVLVGAPFSSQVRVYLGSASGLSGTPATTLAAGGGRFGTSVSSAGDVNGDGYSDIVIGDPGYSPGGRIFLYPGGPTGLSSSTTIAGIATNGKFGSSVSSAGDVNGDGYSDIVVGSPEYFGGQNLEGQASLFYGNGGAGVRNNVRQYRTDLITPVAPAGRANVVGQIGLGLYGRSFLGRQKGQLVWEYRLSGQPFSGSPINRSVTYSGKQSTFTDMGTLGSELKQAFTGLSANASYKWRVRLKYQPSTSVTGQQYGPWKYSSPDGECEGGFRSGDRSGTAPSFTQQPSNLIVTAPASANFTVTATGVPGPTYQWQRNNGAGWVNITAATERTYALASTAAADNGAQFRCVATNGLGSATSNAATLTVQYAPIIAPEPAAAIVTEPAAATFSVGATGNPGTLSYQWRRNGLNITGANSSSYTLTPTSPADTGAIFSVIVSNAVGSDTSVGATLTVRFRPRITDEPDPVSITAPTPAIFTVAAVGNPSSLSYQWYRDDVPILGANAATYTTPPTSTPDDGASFHVVVANSIGSDTSQKASLSVNAPLLPPNVSDPLSLTVTAPQSAAFSTIATGNPTPALQWQRNGVNISGANASTYTVNTTAPGDNGAVFRVIASNSQGADSSAGAVLTVYFPPTLITQPSPATVTVPTSANFSVAAGPANPPAAFQWQKNGVDIIGANSASYATPATTSADNGATYRCVVSNVAGSVTSNAVALTVNYAPTFSVTPTNRTVTAPTGAPFSSAATGNPAPTYQWQRFSASVWTAIPGATSSSYTLTPTVPADNGAQFRVVATNVAGSVTSPVATLTVQYAPIITNQPAATGVTEPASASFSVIAYGNPSSLSYQWRRNGSNITGANSAAYSLSATTAGDNGALFSVAITNLIGTLISSDAALTVLYRPRITAQPVSQAVVSPDAAGFSVTANGNPSSLTYQWLRNGTAIPGATGSSFSIDSTVPGDNGSTFRCVVGNTVGVDTSLAATLSVDAPLSPPNFVSNPANLTVTAPAGGSFSASATGNPSPTYQWQRNGIDVPGATSNTLNLATTAAGDNGAAFRLIAANSQGNDTSANATLSVYYPPTISTQPVSASVTAPATANFSVVLGGANPAPSFQWQRFGAGGWANISGATSASYTTGATVPGDDSAQFRCLVANNAGSVTSAAAVLSVRFAPVLSLQPQSQTVNELGAATFSTSAAGNPAPTFQWQRGSGSPVVWSNIPGAVSASYTLSPVSASDNGAQFRCAVVNAVGSINTNVAVLNVQYLPGFAVQPQSVTVTSPAAATFSAQAAGNPAPTYLWQRFQGGSWAAIPGATNASFTVTPTAASDHGTQFRVIATNAVGSTPSNAVALSVYYKPRITTQPASLAVTSPGPAAFSVAADGNPSTLAYQWLRNGVFIPGATTATYTLAPTTPQDDSALFRVMVSNSIGTDTSLAATLSVDRALSAPVITSDPLGDTVTAPQGTAFSVAATGNPAPAFQWQRNNVDIPGATGNTYNLLSSASGDNGAVFRVIATSSQGRDTSAGALLTVFYAPVITTQPAAVSVTAPAVAGFSVTANAFPSPTYQWQRNGVNIPGAVSAAYTTAATSSADDTALFRCVITNNVGSVNSNAARLTVQYAPAITLQPLNQSVPDLGAATFITSATGNPTAAYQWQRNLSGTWTSIAGATAASFTLSPVSSSDNGSTFRCLITNPIGSLTTNVVTLTVQYAPAFSTQPASLSVLMPASAAFSVAATGSPAPAYQWQRFQGNAWTNITNATGLTYTLAVTDVVDNGVQFRVLASNIAGSTASNAATLTVQFKPRITTQPASLAVSSPNPAILSVMANGSPSLLTYQWQRNNGSWNDILGANAAGYTLNPTAPGDNNSQFRCLVSNSIGTDTSSAATLLVDAVTTPAVIVSDPRPAIVIAPAGAAFSATASGNPTPTFQWQRNGVDVNGATASTYTVNSTSPADNGASYRVIVANIYGRDTSTGGILTVQFPPILATQPSAATVTVPAPATFTVSVGSANPAPTYQWLKNSPIGWINIVGATAASYTTGPTSVADDSAQFLCEVSNSAGSVTSDVAMLTVNTTLLITRQPANDTVIAPGPATFTATASGNPAPAYQWQRLQGGSWNDIPGAVAPSFTLDATSASDDTAQFRVRATNIYGSVNSNPATLTVRFSPVISTQPRSDSVTAPGSVTFSVLATGNPSVLAYQWKRNGINISGATSSNYTLNPSSPSDQGAAFTVSVSNSVGITTSNAATLSVRFAPMFSLELPDSLVALETQRLSLSAQASANPPASYQWQFLDATGTVSNIGTNSGNYTLNNVTPTAAGTYRVIATNGISPADTSRACRVQVDAPPTAPRLMIPPVSRTVMAGQSVTFTVDASGTAPLQYLWQRFQGGQWNAIGGATAASFTIASAQTQDAGSYRALISNLMTNWNIPNTYAAVNPAVTLTVVPVRVSSPLFTPSGHAFIDSVRVALVSDSGAEIRYTTNGSIPTASSPLYAAPILITDTTTLRAFASKSGFSPSTVVSETYDETPTGQTAKPKADPVDSAFFGMVTVTLSTATSPAEIRYTTSGSDPTASSPLYTAPFSLYQTTTVKAIALSTGKQNSALLTKTYTLQYQPKVHTPLASPPGRRFRPPFTVTFSSATDSASIEYTTDGSSPVSSATRRTYPQGGIPLDSSKTLRAAARRTGYLPSDILTETYVKMATSVTATPSMDTAFQDSLRITLTAGGLNIYFTTDGSSPLLPNLARSPSASLYQGAFVLRQSTTLNAVAVDGIDISDTLTLFFTKTGGALPPPVALPMASSFQDTVAVRLLGPSGDPAIAIHYTTDGNDPTSSSTRYTGPIVLDTTKTLKARVLKSGATDSPVFTAVYTLAPPAPLASPRGGHFAGVAKVTLSSKSRKARIYYTLNGQPPSPATSLLYTQGDTLRFNATTTTLRAIASAGNMGSPAITEVYHVAGLLDTVLVAGTGTLIGGGYVAQNVGTGNNPLRLRLSGPESLSVTGFGNVQFSLQATPSVGTAPFPPLMMTRPPLDTRSLYRQGPGGRAVFISSQESTLVLQPGTYFFGTDTTLPIVALLSTTFDANDSTRARLRLDDNTINLLYNLVRSDDAAKNRSGIPAVAPETLSISLKNPAGVFTPLGLSLTLSDHKNATRFPPSGMRYLAQRLTAFQSPPVFHIGERTAYPWDLVSFPFDSDNPPTFGSLSTLNNMQNFAAARFSQAQRAYVNLTAADTIRPGRGYWVRSTTALTTLSVPPFELRPPQTQIRVALDSGWNMLGNPGPVMLYFPAPRSMSAAHRASRVKAPWAYDHNTDSYVASDSLPPWRGFFVFSNVRDTGFALLSQPASQSLPKASAGGFFAEGEAELSLEMAGAKVTLGAFDGAKTGFGFEDEPALPAFGGRAFLMSLRQGRRLMGDYLPFGKDSVHAFTLITGGNAAERPLRLSSLSMPQGFEAWISAPGRGLKQKMAAGNPGFMPAPGGDTLRVVMGTPEALRKSGLLSGQREGVPGFGLRLVNKGKGFILLLDLPAQATVQARLVDLRGKTTATLSARKLGAGHHALSLEQHFQTRDLARGVYFLQIQTQGMGMPAISIKRVFIAD